MEHIKNFYITHYWNKKCLIRNDSLIQTFSNSPVFHQQRCVCAVQCGFLEALPGTVVIVCARSAVPSYPAHIPPNPAQFPSAPTPLYFACPAPHPASPLNDKFHWQQRSRHVTTKGDAPRQKEKRPWPTLHSKRRGIAII